MTSTPCQSAALDRIVAPWPAKIAAFFVTIVVTIVANAKNVRNPLNELGACCRKTGRRLLALCSGLSRPMMSKLDTGGRHARLLRHRASFLPPSASVHYAFARKRSPEFERAVMMDLRGKSDAQIEALFAEPSALEPILVPPELNDAVRCALIADIGAARITDNRRADLEA